ncbi:MAG: AAA family ATPase [Planctomycetes bacterium]|nr:AAA family ATPase [Planctomycetota bacterium]
MKPIYIAATGQHVGKTTMSLGLLAAFKAQGLKCQYVKPVGQRWTERDGQKADEDVWLCKEILETDMPAEVMSPVIVPRGFVTDYLNNPDPERLRRKIRDAQSRLRESADLLVVEGTGHAGVGSCLDLSNAVVAEMLGAVALLIVPGGVGSSLDETALSLALFEAHGVPVVGVIANKIYLDKYDKVRQALEIGFKRRGTRLLGAIPYEPELSHPTIHQIQEDLKAKVLCGHAAMNRVAAHNLVAAMEPEHVVRYIEKNSLVITPGDRIDNILLAISKDPAGQEATNSIVGIVLTGGMMPPDSIMALLKESGLPVLLCDDDTYRVAAEISRRVFKIDPGDSEKIAAAQRFVRDYVDVEAILSAIRDPS